MRDILTAAGYSVGSGKNQIKISCPFHSPDKNPSCEVNLDAGMFHCFSCGEKGGYVKMAKQLGVKKPERSDDKTPAPAETATEAENISLVRFDGRPPKHIRQ